MKKKKITALALSAALLLSGCAGTGAPETAPTESTTISLSTETADNQQQTSESVIPLIDATVRQLEGTQVKVMDGSEYVGAYQLTNYETRVVDENLISIGGAGIEMLRRSSLASCIDETKLSDFEAAIAAAERGFSRPDGMSVNEAALRVNGFSENPLNIVVEDFECTYSLSENLSVKGYVRAVGYDEAAAAYSYSMIIDPAYMHNIPVFSRSTDRLAYEINGTKAYLDALSVDFISFQPFDFIPESGEYVYASAALSYIGCTYSVANGYSCNANLNDIEFISADTEKYLTEPFAALADAVDKDPEMSAVYNAVMNNIGIIDKGELAGIKLIDLDFDGTPEVIASNFAGNKPGTDGAQMRDRLVNADVYRVSGGKLVYIDTLYHYNMLIYGNSNMIGKLTLADGTQVWADVSCKNRSDGRDQEMLYTFVLNGNRLDFTEVFRTEEEVFADGENSSLKLFYYGKDITSEITERPIYGDQMVDSYYEWNEVRAYFGYWELAGFIKQDFMSKTTENYNLYNDWLYNIGVNPYVSAEFKPVSLSEHDLSYRVAMLTDEFFLGYYDNSADGYVYRFLGDYAKPVIYLYPEEKTDVSVKIDLDGELTCTYPDYGDGWNVTAYPDGTLINKEDGLEYSYLYWEGKGEAKWDLSRGFVVKGEDTAEFLQEKLAYLGLTRRELNEFIVYWLPLMQDNPYNLITFQTDAYTDKALLRVSPEPDSVLRIFMVYKPLQEAVDIPEQELSTFEREGFTVVEWGGSCFSE